MYCQIERVELDIMKKRIKILGIIVIFILFSLTAINLVNRNNFFEDALFIKSGASDNGNDETFALSQKAAELSQQTGIKFNPQLSIHAELLRRFDEIVVYDKYFENEFVEKVQSTEDNAENKKIEIFTGEKDTDNFLLNFALIHGLYEEGRYEAVWQIEWKKSPLLLKQKNIRISNHSLAWEIKNPDANVLLLYYDKADCWVEKKISPFNLFNVDYYPEYVTAFSGAEAFSDNRLIQVWGTAFHTTKPLNGTVRAAFWFSFNKRQNVSYADEFKYVVEWWSSEIFD